MLTFIRSTVIVSSNYKDRLNYKAIADSVSIHNNFNRRHCSVRLVKLSPKIKLISTYYGNVYKGLRFQNTSAIGFNGSLYNVRVSARLIRSDNG